MIRSEHESAMTALGVLMVSLAGGCGPGKLLPNPDTLPERLGPRVLWHTAGVYIYAADKAVAAETETWVGELAAHVRRTYGEDIGKGLVIVVDKSESACIPSIEELVRLQRLMAAAGGVPAADQPTIKGQRLKLAESGMSEQMLCLLTSAALDETALTHLGLPGSLPLDVAWRMCCPSQRLMDAAVWDFAPTALEKKKGKAFAVVTAWAWPLAFPEAAKVFRLARDTLAFEIWTQRQADWSTEQRSTEITRYLKERAFVISPTLALALSMAKEEKTERPLATSAEAPEAAAP